MQQFKERLQQMEWFERHLFLATAATACLILGCIIHGEQFLLMPQISFLMGLLIVALALPLTTWLPEPIKKVATDVCEFIGIRTIFSLTAIAIMLVIGMREPIDGFVLQVYLMVSKASVMIVFLGSVRVMLIPASNGQISSCSISIFLSVIMSYVAFSLAVVWSVGWFGDAVNRMIIEATPEQLAGMIAFLLIFFACLCAESFSRTPQLSGKRIQTLGYAKYGHAGMVSDKPFTLKSPDSNK